jgi:nucleotide-binding universal stress UspA family protein
MAAGEIDELMTRSPEALVPILAPDTAPAPASGPAAGFARVVCGIDSSPESTEALRQASMLAAEGARIVGVSVWDPAAAAHGSHQSPQLIDFVRNRAAAALTAARERVPTLRARLIQGGDVTGVLEAATTERADLLSVGSHTHSRAAGIALGSVATAAIHRAPCSVLIARRTDRGPRVPDRIIHAGDGSADSRLAATVAARVAGRYGSALTALHVDGGTRSPHEIVEEAASLIEAVGVEPVVEVQSGTPHRRIVEVAGEIGAALVVLGSRGLSGVRALGSVSERVAHQAPCSVLIVRSAEPAGVHQADLPAG